MHNDKIGRERGAIKAMKTLELIIAFKEQLCKLWIDKDKLYVCTNVIKITQLVYTGSSKRKKRLVRLNKRSIYGKLFARQTCGDKNC